MSPGRPIRAAALGLMLIGATPGSALGQLPGTRLIEELTWTEVRDALESGHGTVIVPIGGTEQNGPHMVTGKHNYVVSFAAREMADRLGNALVAPTLQYVPQGDYDSPGFGEKPGVISNPSPTYEAVLEWAARSLAAHGFTDILLLGDSGGNQNGMTAVADKLNAEWEARSARVYALTDYYRRGQEYARVWLQARYGYEPSTIGTHAGITDTSAMMYAFPEGVRLRKRLPGGGGPDAGVSGDPTRATPEIGRMVIEFKILAALAQYEALRTQPRARSPGG